MKMDSEEYGFEGFPMPYDIIITADSNVGTTKVKYTLDAVRKETELTEDETASFEKETPIAQILDRLYNKAREKVEGGADYGAIPDACDDLGPSDSENSGADPTVVARCASFDHSDTDNGKRLIEHFGRDLLVMAQSGVAGGDWLAWGDTHWDQAGGLAHAVVPLVGAGPQIRGGR